MAERAGKGVAAVHYDSLHIKSKPNSTTRDMEAAGIASGVACVMELAR